MNLVKNTVPCKNDEKIAQESQQFKKIIDAYIPGTCPLSQQLAQLQTSITLSCGKCVPCRDGLVQLKNILTKILDGKGTPEDFEDLKQLATTIKNTADCAIGYMAATSILKGTEIFNDEYLEHINNKNCSSFALDCAPCVSYCPANVDIPAYISLTKEGKFEDAIRAIKNDNPFPTACAYVCEHPCENKCRRVILDDAINIRGLKRYAVENCDFSKIKSPEINEDTGKNIAIIGGGPSGLTAAYFLSNMGHKVKIFEAKEKLGGMLRYGIPNYRLPKNKLDQDIKMILDSSRIEAETNTKIDSEKFSEISKNYDAVYLAIGAQSGKMLGISGANAEGVYSAVEVLDLIGNGKTPDYSGKKVVVIGGGNVAMDAARSAVRCGAKDVSIVYRRRQEDMTALESEVQAAIEEGVELLTLYAPKEISTDGDKVCALIASPQMIGPIGKDNRPKPVPANKPDYKIDCDIVLIAIGQDINSKDFEACEIDEKRKTFITNKKMSFDKQNNIFAGGDCVLGPATVIKAVANGKNAAIKIDEYLGYHHEFKEDIQIPEPQSNNRTLYGRVNLEEVPAKLRKSNFDAVENNMSEEEALQECNKCLRCDHFGCNSVEGGR